MDRKRIRKTFPTLAAAKSWRADAQVAVSKGSMRLPSKQKLSQAASNWLRGAMDGSVRNRSGDRYKPSALRGYEEALRLRVLPALGHVRLSEVRRNDLQDLADRLLADGLNPSTIRNTLMPVRAIYRRAMARGDVAVNPTTGIELPAVRGIRDRIADPEEAAQLVDVVPERDRAIWATAMYAGLRLGELRALRWQDVDLAAGVVRVERSWDARVGPVDPKSRAGKRKVPIPGVLRDILIEHRMSCGRDAGLIFGRSESNPFSPNSVANRARSAWQAAELSSITLHEARHTFASLMIAAGVNAKALSTYMGHSSITITLDRYGHLMPGSESEAAGLLGKYLERSTSLVRS